MGIWSPGPGASGGADVFTGDDSNETADGLGGTDTLNGNGGADTLTGNDGDDTLRPGDDYLADIVSGGNGYDILDYSSLAEDGVIYLGTISYRSHFNNSSLWDMLSGVEEVIGTQASDIVIARPGGADVLRGGAGNDFMDVQNLSSNPALYGGAGRDFFFLGASNYRIMDFEVGVDRFAFGQAASMTISGADTLLTSSFGAVVRIVGINSLTLAEWQAHAHPGFVSFDAFSDTDDAFTGGADDDWAWGGSGNDTFDGGAGDDTLLGGQGDDLIDGGNGADLLEGGSGDDILLGNVGADTIVGGSGVDTATYASLGIGITASLATNTASDGDTLSGIENLTGTDFADTLTGDAGANVLRGQSGGDVLDGGDGADTLDGGAGVDVMTGGLGDDTLQTDLAGPESGDQFLGGDGLDTIRVGDIFGGQQLFNFGVAAVSSIERIQFASNVGISIVGFGAGQIGTGFSNFTQVVGSNGINLVSVVAGAPQTFSLEGWSFANWSAGDAVLLNGSSGDDVITGSSQADHINGHEGVDTLNGGLGDDIFIVNLSNLQAGDQFHGGDGVDAVHVGDAFAGQQLFNFGPATVSGIERIHFTSTTGEAIVGIAASQLGAGFSNSTHVVGSGTLNIVSIVAGAPASFSLAGWTFENWSPGDAVLLDGSSGGDTLTGSTQGDRISGHDGNDQVFGGFGGDIIDGGAGDDIIDGGAGVDFADIDTNSADATWHRDPSGGWSVATAAFGTDTLTNVEFISFSDRTVFLDRAARTFSGNGTSDILFRRADGVMASWEVTGATIDSAAFLPTAGAEWSVLGTGDISGDGRDDVIWQRSDGLVYSWTTNGGAVAATVGVTGIGPQWSFLGVGDFNRDFVDDLAWRRDDGLVFIWTMQNSAIQSASAVTGLSAVWELAGLGDFNGDGRDDFLWRRSDNGLTAIWHMDGAAIQSSGATTTQTGLTWSVVGAGDTDGDGRDDIILQRASDGMISIWTMNGTTVLSATDVAAANPAQWTVRGIGDYNGDGRDDILWQHDDGLVYVWLMNGASIQSAGALAGIGPEWGII